MKKLPVYENEKLSVENGKKRGQRRFIEGYSDEKAVPFFNSDNCGGRRFPLYNRKQNGTSELNIGFGSITGRVCPLGYCFQNS